MCWREIEGEWSGYSVCITWPLNKGYPALIPMIKSWDMLPNSTESHELGIKIKESVSTLLLLYANPFHSCKDSNTMACWHSEFNCLQVSSSLESGPTFWISMSLPPSEDLDVSSSSLALIINLSIVLSILRTLLPQFLHVSRQQPTLLLFTAAKFSSANCCTSRSLNVTFFAAILLFTELQNFSMEFKLG